MLYEARNQVFISSMSLPPSFEVELVNQNTRSGVTGRIVIIHKSYKLMALILFTENAIKIKYIKRNYHVNIRSRN